MWRSHNLFEIMVKMERKRLIITHVWQTAEMCVCVRARFISNAFITPTSFPTREAIKSKNNALQCYTLLFRLNMLIVNFHYTLLF